MSQKTLGVCRVGPWCRPLASSALRPPFLANPDLFRNPNMVFESTYICTATTKSFFPMASGVPIPRSTETESLIESYTRQIWQAVVSTRKGTRKVEWAHHFWKCADAVCQKWSKLICACRKYSLPKLARFYWDILYITALIKWFGAIFPVLKITSKLNIVILISWQQSALNSGVGSACIRCDW